MSELSKRETKRLMNVIKDQIDTMLSYQDQIPLIEIDLVKNSIQQLYQQLEYLAKPLDKNIQLENIIGKTDSEAEDLLNQAEKEFSTEQKEFDKSSSAKTSEDVSPLPKDKEEKPSSPEAVEDKADSINFEEEQSKIEKEKTIEKIEEPKNPVEDKPQENQKKEADKRKQISIIDVISDDETSLGDQFQKSGIKDLKSAIGINDKFQFINDLFEGSMSEYNSFIKTIDNFGSKQEAFEYLEKISSQNKWSRENETFKLFISYLERRY